MQLHVLGPAFGLPSIDAECLAAVALLQLHPSPGWSIIIADGLTDRLPFLVDGEVKVEGFRSISRHLTHHYPIREATTSDQESADSIALTSFLETHGRILLDISLYVSSSNYHSATRAAFTRILPWYANYFVPPRRRADARARTAHLGISSIDVEDVHDDGDLSNRSPAFDTSVGKEKAFEAETKQRASLLLPNQNTVRSLLGRAEHSAVFKLHALADNFFAPLEDMLGDESGSYFLGTEEPQAVDCEVYAYLALMLYPALPQPWLAETLRRKYGKLLRFTEGMHQKLKMQTDVAAVMRLGKCKTKNELEGVRSSHNVKLPFAPLGSVNAVDVAKSIAFDLASRIPFIGPARTDIVPSSPQQHSFWQNRYFPASLAATAASIGLLGYYSFAAGFLVWPRGEPIQIFGRRKLSDYGHLGAALAGINVLSQQSNDDVIFRPQDLGDNPVRVEVEVEKDELP